MAANLKPEIAVSAVVAVNNTTHTPTSLVKKRLASPKHERGSITANTVGYRDGGRVQVTPLWDDDDSALQRPSRSTLSGLRVLAITWKSPRDKAF